MLLGSLGLVLGIVYEPVGKLVILMCLPLLAFFVQVLSFFEAMGWVVQLDTFLLTLALGYFLFLAFIVFNRNKRAVQNAESRIQNSIENKRIINS